MLAKDCSLHNISTNRSAQALPAQLLNAGCDSEHTARNYMHPPAEDMAGMEQVPNLDVQCITSNLCSVSESEVERQGAPFTGSWSTARGLLDIHSFIHSMQSGRNLPSSSFYP